MSKKVKEPFLVARTMNMVLGFIILLLILFVIYKEGDTRLLQVIILGLAAIENFIAATIRFSEQKKLRGNILAVISAVFLIAAVIMTVGLLGIL